MPTVNFSVPEDVKKAFDETFKNRNPLRAQSNTFMTLVVDANVVVKWLLSDPERESATVHATNY